MNYINRIPTFQRKKTIPKQLKNLELLPMNEQLSKLTTPILSDDYMRPAMMGNFFDMENRKIVSTDAHKLTAINMPNETFDFIKQTYKKELNENPKGLIFHTLSQLKSDYNELVKLLTKNNTDDVQSFDEYVKIRQIEDGTYPDYEAIIPRDFTNVVNVDYSKLYWYAKVLLDAKVIDDATKINSSNNTEYENKKIEYLKDSYVSFLDPITDTESKKIIEKDIILTYTLDGEKQYIIFNAIFLCQILKFAMEFNGKYFGKIGISGNFRGILIEFEDGFLLSNSFGILMPVRLRNDNNTIGDEDYNNNVKMYYDLDTNSIVSGDSIETLQNYPIDESIGFKANKESLSIPKMTSQQGKMKKHTEMVNKVKSQQVTTEVTSDNSYIDDIDIENKILIVAEKGKPLSKYKNGDKVFFADYSADKNWKLYVEGEVFIKDNEYSIKRFPQNITFKKYPLATFNSNTKVALKPNNEPIYYSDKTIKNNGVKNTQNDSASLIDSRIKGLRIALKVAKAENKAKIEKRIKGLEIAQKMQPKQKTNNTNTYEDLLEQDRDLQNEIDEEKRKPTNEQSELKRLALEREVILRKIDEMEQFNNGGGVGRIVMIPTYVVKEIKDSVEMGYDTLVEGMIGRVRKGVLLINKDYEVRGTYDIGLKDAIQDLIKKIKLGNFKVDAIDETHKSMRKMNNGGGVDGIDWYKYDGQYEAEFGNFYLYVIPSNERGRYYVRVTDGYRGDIISQSTEEILGLDNAKEFAIDIVGDYMKQFNKGGVVFTNYNGSEIMYEPNYDEYFVNDEVFYSMEEAKNYIDTGEMENEKYGFGGGLLVGSLVGGYLGYKVGKYNKQVVSSGFQTEKLIGKDIKNKLQGKKTYAKGGGVAETMHFFVVIDKNDKNYNRVGYVFDETETIFDKDGNEFEKLNFENQKVAKKYNVKDLIYLEKRNTFTQKDKYGDNDIEYVILVNYQYSSKPFDFYYYLYNVTKKLVATEGNLDWVKSNLPKGFKLNTSYADGGGVGSEIEFNRYGEQRTGTIYEDFGDDTYGVQSGTRKVLVKKGDITKTLEPQMKRKFRFFKDGGGVDTISDEDLLRIKLAVAEAQDRINANQNESESGGIDGITKFIKENPQVLLMLEKGGSVGDENYEMLKNKVTELLHHSKELQAVVKKKPKTPAWVISKSSRASTDLSDITHYLEGKL